ncbi:NKAP family protein-like isoform X2 [Penaeus japonicus]|uniref:NKAP family protein-like isoform X2 n=1 Tax=Penaeus japonicus TaxID=27405 RepID=UPI001C713E05|nr:NKAP family protein-like isoform X2 [Penaeus japonicus]
MSVRRNVQVLLVMVVMTNQLPWVMTAARYSSSWRDNPNDCYAEKGEGLRLQASHVDKYVSVDSLRDCEEACDLAFFACKSFSYSYYHNREPENCLLSREDSYTLDLRDDRDFYRDADFVFYEKSSGRDCDYKNDHSSSGDSCYELVKTRSRIDPRYIIRGKVLRTRDRRECEQECDREYDCRGFNYRFKTIGYDQYRDNCELSSEGAGNRYDFLTDDDFDFYEKSRNCRNNGNNNYGNNNYGNNNYGNNNYGNNNYGNNNYGFRDECFRLAKIETTIERPRDRVDVRDIRECEDECKRTRRFTCRSFAFRYSSGGTWARDNCYLSDREFRELNTYELLHDRSFDFYERRLYDRECGIDDHNHDHHDNQGEGGDMTVNGIQCYRGRCREDREGGYWYCHTDFSEAWDYCCRPREVCGYSQGYEQKWCYVGSEGRDQWRPCKGQGRDRDYLKEEGPPMSAEATTLEPFMNLTSLEVLDLNDLTI